MTGSNGPLQSLEKGMEASGCEFSRARAVCKAKCHKRVNTFNNYQVVNIHRSFWRIGLLAAADIVESSAYTCVSPNT